MFSEVFGRIALILAEPLPGRVEMRQTKRNVESFVKVRDDAMIRQEVGGIDEVIRAGISAMRHGLDYELRQHLPIGYDDFILHNAKCETLELELSGDQRQKVVARVIIAIMEAMHDVWAKKHLDELSTKATLLVLDDQFRRQFVPFPLSGWELVRRYYLVALELFGGNQPLPNESLVINLYGENRVKFCQQNDIRDARTLQQKIMGGAKFYPILSGKAEELISRGASAKRMAEVIMGNVK